MHGQRNKTVCQWPEPSWRNPDIDWKNAEFVTVGIDVGSVSAQAVIVADGEILAYGNVRSGWDGSGSALKAYRSALQAAGDLPEDRFNYCIGTGYGRVNIPDIKAIRCDEKGKVVTFLMNDKCAAGTGRGMEVFADLLGIPVTDVGDRSFRFEGEAPEALSNDCVVYARSEAIGLIRQGWRLERVLAAYCTGMAQRIYAVLERTGVTPQWAVTGGMAKNRGVINRLVAMIGAEDMKTPWDPQIAGAVGAALFAHTLCRKGKAKRQ
ncbi:MAG: benzoyl-CoA reductase, bzd-type, subunit Q [Deltaproteobacteria bacterium]|nr:benzoyl-CoA reductase, bzd-type, subunit Q [Deltaproteobacteria bacterium]